MRGLPPPPVGVARWTATFDNDGVPATFSNWIAVPGLDLATVAELQALLAVLHAYFSPLPANLCHQGCAWVRVSLKRWGTFPLELEEQFIPVFGRWSGGQLAVGATVLHWLSGRGGAGGDSLSFVPGFPDEFTDDHASLNDTGFANALAYASEWLNGVNATPGIAGGHCVHGTVHQKQAGAPLAVATFTPTVGVRPSSTVGTLDRRRPYRR